VKLSIDIETLNLISHHFLGMLGLPIWSSNALLEGKQGWDKTSGKA
jgi:hypothetical protein